MAIFWFLLLIGIMILIHELGHYLAAVYFDVRVQTFSFGFGPRLFGFRRGETDFRVSAIPFGGYVRMEGENPTDPASDDPRAFQAKPRWQRLVIAFAGPWMNIVLAVGILIGLYMVQYPKLVDSQAGLIGYVDKDSAAEKAGILAGDRILAVGGVANPTWQEILFQEAGSAGQPLPVTIDRNGEVKRLTVTPIMHERDGIGLAGWTPAAEVQIAKVESGMDADRMGLKIGDVLVSINGERVRSGATVPEVIQASGGEPVEITYRRDDEERTVVVKPELKDVAGESRYLIGVALEPRREFVSLSFPAAVSAAIDENVQNAGLIYRMLKSIVEQRMSPKSIEGPIRIAQFSGEAAERGPAAYLMLMSLVSLNLAIFNLLPVPVLDGGLIAMLLIEMVVRRDLSLQLKENVMKFGFVFLMMVVMFVLYNDVRKTIGG